MFGGTRGSAALVSQLTQRGSSAVRCHSHAGRGHGLEFAVPSGAVSVGRSVSDPQARPTKQPVRALQHGLGVGHGLGMHALAMHLSTDAICLSLDVVAHIHNRGHDLPRLRIGMCRYDRHENLLSYGGVYQDDRAALNVTLWPSSSLSCRCGGHGLMNNTRVVVGHNLCKWGEHITLHGITCTIYQ
jgi:hypothetical protein